MTQTPQGLVEGGIFNYLIGTVEVVALGALIALPLGILTGLYLTEFAGPRSRTAGILKLALDMMQGLPTIVVGLFIYGLVVIPQHKQSGFAASLALAIVMVPLMARSSQEVLLLVPNSLREAADALGVSRWRTVLSVILPAALGGIATGAILAIARAAGETAPVLICDSLYNPDKTQLEHLPRRADHPDAHLHVGRSPDPAGRRARLGRRADADADHPASPTSRARVMLARTRAKMGT